MKTYDWIVVGAGITGAALSYALTKKGFSVLLLEQHAAPESATRYSYGSLNYWLGTSDLTNKLCIEGERSHRHLAVELDADTEFREIDTLLTIDPCENPQTALNNYDCYLNLPQLLSPEDACIVEPQLNPRAIAGALLLKQGHINPQATANAYCQATLRNGGVMEIAKVLELVRRGDRITGVVTREQTYSAANIAICAGGLTRRLLKAAGIAIRLYFTRAELIETPPVDIRLRTIVMPANAKRPTLEAKASAARVDRLWDELGNEPVSPIIDPGAVQFLDGTIKLGQVSRVLTDPEEIVDIAKSEAAIRASVSKILPTLGQVPGTWRSCLVAFSGNGLPVVGAVGDLEGIYVFSGLTNPMVFVLPLAQRFANYVAGEGDDIIPQLTPVTSTR